MFIAFNSFLPALLGIVFLCCKVLWGHKIGSTTIAEVSFRHAFYLVRDVRVADIRVAWLVYLACLRSHILRAYCNLESKQANSISLFGRRPNKYCHGKVVSRGTGSPHNLPVCNRLLFYSKCTVFTVCFIYSDISPSMYWNHCQVNVELPYM